MIISTIVVQKVRDLVENFSKKSLSSAKIIV